MSQKRPYVIMPTCRHDSTKDNGSVGYPKKIFGDAWVSGERFFHQFFAFSDFPNKTLQCFVGISRSLLRGKLRTYQPSIFRGYSLVFMGRVDSFSLQQNLPQATVLSCLCWAEFLKPPHLLLKTSLTPQSKRSMYFISSSELSTDFMSTNSSLLIWVGGLGF